MHRDIKPDNFAIGLDGAANTIFLFDFGLSKSYYDSMDRGHILNRGNKRLIGTVRYASVNTHMGYEQSRRDDLESLGYTLVYFMQGRLPWQGVQGPDKLERQEKIFSAKLRASLDSLCKGLPTDVLTYMYYCRSLGFEDEPNYGSLRREFRKSLASKGMDKGFEFDWVKRDKAQLKIGSTDGLLRVQNKLVKREEEKKEHFTRNMASGQLIKVDLDGKEIEDKKDYLKVPLANRFLAISSNNGTNITEKGDSNDSCNFNAEDIREAGNFSADHRQRRGGRELDAARSGNSRLQVQEQLFASEAAQASEQPAGRQREDHALD